MPTSEGEIRAYCKEYGIRYKKGMQILPTREMMPLTSEQRTKYNDWLRTHRNEPIEEPLPPCVRCPVLMNLVFDSMVKSGLMDKVA